MPGKRLLRILARLPAFPDPEPSTARLCEVAAELASMSGAGIMLMSGETAQGTLCSSNAVSTAIEDWQYTLGEGPCVDAYRHGRPVLEPDLANPVAARWLAFSPHALRAGARAIFGFPIRTAGVRLGALNLYRDEAGPLTFDQQADSVVMAEVAARAVVAMQAAARPGALAPDLEEMARLHLVVHQASGMVSAQLDISIPDALVRMRAYAFINDQVLDDVAKAVVTLRLRFEG